jgi:hypothetical protein
MTAPAMTPSHIRRITSRLRAVSAAQNITPSLFLYTPVRWFLNILRGVDSFIFAMLIKSDPGAMKAVRVDVFCSECQSKIQMYAALVRSS